MGIYTTDPNDGVTTRRIPELNSAVGLAVLDSTLYWSDRTDGQLLSIVLNEVTNEGVSVATGLGRVGDVTAANTETPSSEFVCVHDRPGDDVVHIYFRITVTLPLLLIIMCNVPTQRSCKGHIILLYWFLDTHLHVHCTCMYGITL